jgi:regulator of sigma E protease
MEGEDEDSSDERAFNNKPAWQRFLVCIAGATMNLILGFIIMVIIISCFANLVGTRKVGFIAENSAFSEKLQLGDEIISVNNLKVYTTTDVYYEFSRDADKSVDMIIKRNGEKIEINSISLTTVVDKDGKETVSMDLKFYGEKKNLFNVIKEAAIETVSNARLVFLSLVDLIKGRYSVNELSGPVGVTSVISQAANYGLDSLLNVVAFISINVGVFNLLPFPALDGGRSIVLIGEMITRKHLNRKVEAIINVIGLGILLLVMLFATYNDILKLF